MTTPDHKRAKEIAETWLTTCDPERILAQCYLDALAKIRASLDAWEKYGFGTEEFAKTQAALREILGE